MTKSDLRTGMVVKDQDGLVGAVLRDTSYGDGIKWFYDTNEKKYINTFSLLDEEYHEDLTSDELLIDIVEIYQPAQDFMTTSKGYSKEYLIWKREEEFKEITIAEVERKFGYKVKIIG